MYVSQCSWPFVSQRKHENKRGLYFWQLRKQYIFNMFFLRANFKKTSQQLKFFHFLPPVFPRPPLGNIIFLKNNKIYILLRFFCRRFSRDSPSEKYKFKYIYIYMCFWFSLSPIDFPAPSKKYMLKNKTYIFAVFLLPIFH